MAEMDFETPLAAWARRTGISMYEVTRRTGISYKQVCQYRDGRALPSLVSAFKLERATEGAVAPVLWLGTPLGRHMWDRHSDWEKWQETRKRIAKTARDAAFNAHLPMPQIPEMKAVGSSGSASSDRAVSPSAPRPVSDAPDAEGSDNMDLPYSRPKDSLKVS